MPEVAVAPPPRARQRGRRRRARAGRRRRSTTSTLVAVTAGPGPGRRAARRASRRPRRWPRRARLPLAPVDHLHGHVAANFLAPEPIEPPFLCLLASGGHTLLARVDDPRGYERARPHARRRRRRGVRQGRAAARASATRAGRRSSAWRARATRSAFDFPIAQPRRRAWTSRFAGLKTALLYKVRDLGEEEARAPARRPRRLLPARDRRGAGAARRARRSRATGRAGWRSAAAWRPTAPLRERARAALGVPTCTIPPPELCTDNAAMIAGRRALRRAASPYPGYLGLDAYATGERGREPRSHASTLYSRPGCHLCDDARASLERVRADVPFELARSTSSATTACTALPRAHPGGRGRRRGAFEFFVDEADAAAAARYRESAR